MLHVPPNPRLHHCVVSAVPVLWAAWTTPSCYIGMLKHYFENKVHALHAWLFSFTKNVSKTDCCCLVCEVRCGTNSNLILGDCVLNSCLIVIWITGPFFRRNSAQFENPQFCVKIKKYFPVFTIFKYIFFGIRALFWSICKKNWLCSPVMVTL